MLREGMEDYEYLRRLSDAGDPTLAHAIADALFPHAYETEVAPERLMEARERDRAGSWSSGAARSTRRRRIPRRAPRASWRTRPEAARRGGAARASSRARRPRPVGGAQHAAAAALTLLARERARARVHDTPGSRAGGAAKRDSTRRQNARTSFPKLSFRSIHSWASRARAAGSTASTTGFTAPEATSGRTSFANACVAAIFSSIGRGPGLDADDRAAGAHGKPEIQLRLRAAHRPIDDAPPAASAARFSAA